jgi:hypothetical protein
LDPSFPNIFILSFGSSAAAVAVAFSLPLPFTVFEVSVANSSASGAGALRERVAVRMLCLIEARRLKVLVLGVSWTRGGDREEEAMGGMTLVLMRWCDAMAKTEEDGLGVERTAEAAAMDDVDEQRQSAGRRGQRKMGLGTGRVLIEEEKLRI